MRFKSHLRCGRNMRINKLFTNLCNDQEIIYVLISGKKGGAYGQGVMDHLVTSDETRKGYEEN